MELTDYIEQVGKKLVEKKRKLVTAESCTGGEVAAALTSIPGSSAWFERGFVTYTNISKQEMLGVKSKTLEIFGAVSEETVSEMAMGALAHSHADFALAITGIAGPAGGSVEKPVGTVWFGWVGENTPVITQLKTFSGNRQEIRQQSVFFAIKNFLINYPQ